jgi:hypothetical protein
VLDRLAAVEKLVARVAVLEIDKAKLEFQNSVLERRCFQLEHAPLETPFYEAQRSFQALQVVKPSPTTDQDGPLD